MLLSVVSVLVVAQSSSEVPEGLMNNPVYVLSLLLNICSTLNGVFNFTANTTEPSYNNIS